MKTDKKIEEIIDRFDKLFDNRMFDAPSIKAHIKHFFREELTNLLNTEVQKSIRSYIRFHFKGCMCTNEEPTEEDIDNFYEGYEEYLEGEKSDEHN